MLEKSKKRRHDYCLARLDWRLLGNRVDHPSIVPYAILFFGRRHSPNHYSSAPISILARLPAVV
jgi:hypothetical protein